MKNFVGTSASALILYFVAIGFTPIEILCTLLSTDVFERLRENVDVARMADSLGATPFRPFQETIEKMTIQKIGFFPTLQDIRQKFGKNLVIATYKLSTS